MLEGGLIVLVVAGWGCFGGFVVANADVVACFGGRLELLLFWKIKLLLEGACRGLDIVFVVVGTLEDGVVAGGGFVSLRMP